MTIKNKKMTSKTLQVTMYIILSVIMLTQVPLNATALQSDTGAFDDCSNKIANTMHDKSSKLDNVSAINIAANDNALKSKIVGYKSSPVTVFHTWSIDNTKCDVSLYRINIGYVLYDTADNYIKNVVVIIDPSNTKVEKIDEYIAPMFTTSANWSGYEIAGNSAQTQTIWESKTQYTLPAVSKNTIGVTNPCRTDLGKEPCDLAIWTGLANVSGPINPPLAQAGSDGKIVCTSSTSCTTSYFLWFEFLPSAFICSGPNPPVPGNTITSIVTNQGKTTQTPSTLYNMSVQSSNGFGCSTTGYNYSAMNAPKWSSFINERANESGNGFATLAQFSSDTMTGWIYTTSQVLISTSGTASATRIMNNGAGDNITLGSISSGHFSETYSTSAGT